MAVKAAVKGLFSLAAFFMPFLNQFYKNIGKNMLKIHNIT